MNKNQNHASETTAQLKEEIKTLQVMLLQRDKLIEMITEQFIIQHARFEAGFSLN